MSTSKRYRVLLIILAVVMLVLLVAGFWIRGRHEEQKTIKSPSGTHQPLEKPASPTQPTDTATYPTPLS